MRFHSYSLCLVIDFTQQSRRPALAAVPPLPKSFEDAARQHLAVEEELDRICGSVYFRTSRRSCEFLQYIVRVTLDGRMDSLKERSIGIDLLGRDTSYEPSSDATVRVRANEVRKRLSSFYAAKSFTADIQTLQIQLPTGSYVPRFVEIAPSIHSKAALEIETRPETATEIQYSIAGASSVPVFSIDRAGGAPDATSTRLRHATSNSPAIPPIRALTLMRPALLALLVCTLLFRHQLENREEYLRFWDRLLTGRSAMVLSVSPQDREDLASSLYPLVWVAGKYGVDATMQGDSLTGAVPEATSTVHVSFATPSEELSDQRLRWALTVPTASSGVASIQSPTQVRLRDRNVNGGGFPGDKSVGSLALMTILPEDRSTLHVQGTDADAIRRLLEGLTVERNFPSGLAEQIERLDSRHALQVLVFRDFSGEWHRDIFEGSA